MSTQPEREFVPEWTDGEKLRKIRRHLGMTQEDFAAALQVKPTTYSSWETDRNQIRDAKTIARRLKVLAGTPMWWFLDTEKPAGGPETDPPGGVVRPKGFEPLTSWLARTPVSTRGFGFPSHISPVAPVVPFPERRTA